ncbi:MAG: hypothetical protein GXP02_04140 [Alphaproteobacteria bacterium]|nr:hypothetical protein [Alphaproteobacteria bacterium]
MIYQATPAENFTPLLVAGLMIRPLPTAPLDRLLSYIARRIQDNHPAILERLRPLAGTRFLICPTDLPYEIELVLGEDRVDCHLRRSHQPDTEVTAANVTISGSFLSLVDMMDGKQDGDGLFFSRSLTVTGDTEALLTLRNAVDSDDIDLRAEILARFGPLKTPAEIFMSAGDRLYHRLARDMSVISRAITGPLSDRCEDLEQENQGLRDRLGRLEQTSVKTRNRLQVLGRKIAS